MKIFSSKWISKFIGNNTVMDATAIQMLARGVGGASVGDIKTSILTELQLNDPDWVLADGRPVPESAYETITGNSTVPDLRGKFLRGLDNGRGLDLNRAMASDQAEDLKGHGHNASHSLSWSSAGAKTDSNLAGVLYRPIGYPPYNLSNLTTGPNVPVGGSVSVTPTTGEETRPTNVSVNYFIKVN